LSDAHRQDDPPSFVASTAYILGAASSYSSIDRTRILVTTDRIKKLIEVSTAIKTECDAAFRDTLAAGEKANGSGELDRLQAGAALATLERMVRRYAVEQVRGYE
jgi:hypothetical protein